MATLEERIIAATDKSEAAALVLDQVANGPADGPTSLVTTDNGPVKTTARLSQEISLALRIVVIDATTGWNVPAGIDQLEFVEILGAGGGG